MIEIAVGEYNVDMSKLMAAAVKKYHEERDTYYLGTFNRDNYIRADTGLYWIFLTKNKENFKNIPNDMDFVSVLQAEVLTMEKLRCINLVLWRITMKNSLQSNIK